MLLLSACSGSMSRPPAASSTPLQAASSDGAPGADRPAPDLSAGPEHEPETKAEPEPGPAPERQPDPKSQMDPSYDFSQPVPEGEAVDNSYFEDAVFIGDSRTEGFFLYSGIDRGERLTSIGLSIFRLAEKKALTINGREYTLLEALALKEYSKVYLSFGINELGYNNNKGFYNGYCNAVDTIRASQPHAVIYIQGLIPINEAKAKQGRDYMTNARIQEYNSLMRQAAQEKQVAFLDLYPGFADENGELPADATSDGIHIKSAYCKQWLEYLRTHTVEFETLYPDWDPTQDLEETEYEDPS